MSGKIRIYSILFPTIKLTLNLQYAQKNSFCVSAIYAINPSQISNGSKKAKN